MSRSLRIPVTVSIASEFRYEEPLIDDSTLTIVISQSGETIDTLAALRLARECGSTVISVVNVKGSTIARESDYVIYTHGGPEIAVASTKAYTVPDRCPLSSLLPYGTCTRRIHGGTCRAVHE